MVTEWEKEELGRLTHQKLKSFSQQQAEMSAPAGRMTLQNLQCMKEAESKTGTKQAKIRLLLDRLKLAVTTGISGLFAPSEQRLKEDRCKVYGHNWPPGTTWKGAFPKCLDCHQEIKDPSDLRGAMPRSEREKFKSFGER